MPEKKIPKVRIGDAWVPAHRIWNVVETITTAADLVEKFNETRAPLTTAMTREVVAKVRVRIRDMELQMGGEDDLPPAAAEAARLMAAARDEALAATGSNALADADETGMAGSNELADAAAGPRGSHEVTPMTGNGRRLSDADFAETAKQLLAAMPLEDALRMLEADYDNEVDLRALVKLVGKDVYLDNLAREAQELVANMIGPDQIAELWSDSGFPSPIGGRWTPQDVERLLN